MRACCLLMRTDPAWHGAADAWFKLLAAIAIGYVILAQMVSLVKTFADVSVIAIGGVLLAYFVYPAVAGLNRRLPLWAALTIVYLGGLAAIAATFYILVPAAIVQAQALRQDLPAIQQSALSFMQSPSNPFFAHLPSTAQEWIQGLPRQIGAEVARNLSGYTAKVIDAFQILLVFAAMTIAIPVVSIYMLAEASTIKRTFVRAFKPRARKKVIDVLADVDRVIGGFIRGQIIVAIVVGILAILALVLLHVRYAFIIGIWAGVMDVIPYIGPFAGAIPAFVIALIFNGIGDAAGVVAAFVAINQLEGHLLGPRIVSSTVKITPLAVIFSLLICAKVFGFLGLLIAVPIAGIVRVILLHVFGEDDVSNAQLKPGLTHEPKSEMNPRSTES
jgi:predicted PurR-regulated permease PerM